MLCVYLIFISAHGDNGGDSSDTGNDTTYSVGDYVRMS